MEADFDCVEGVADLRVGLVGVVIGEGGVGGLRTGELGYAGEYTGYEAFVVLVVCAAGGGGLLDRCDGDGYSGRYRTRSLLVVFLHLGGWLGYLTRGS